MGCSTPGFPVQHQLPELAQAPVHQIGDATQPLSSCYPPAFNLAQHQGIFHPLQLLPVVNPEETLRKQNDRPQVAKMYKIGFNEP